MNDREASDEIGEILWAILTHNTEDYKYPEEALLEKFHAYGGNRLVLARTIMESLAEACSYTGIGEDPMTAAFRSMTEACARAHLVA